MNVGNRVEFLPYNWKKVLVIDHILENWDSSTEKSTQYFARLHKAGLHCNNFSLFGPTFQPDRASCSMGG